MKLKLNSEIICGTVFILFNSIYLSQALKLPFLFEQGEPGPIFFPLILIVIMYICSFLILIQGLKGEKNFTFNLSFFMNKNVFAIFFSALYIIFFNTLGYWLITLLYSFIISIFFEYKKRKTIKLIVFSFIIALVITTLVWLLFEVLFKIKLPVGGIWENV